MISQLRNWSGAIEIDGKHFDSVAELSNFDFKTLSDNSTIKLLTKVQKSQIESNTSEKQYCITVKQYMTKKATPDFDFMAQWNNDNPMPMRTMMGTVERETRGMVYMHLHGVGVPTVTCMCCGKELTNPISKHYGIGPICLNKMGINRDIEDVDGIKDDLRNLEWSGWIIRSSIISQEPVD